MLLAALIAFLPSIYTVDIPSASSKTGVVIGTISGSEVKDLPENKPMLRHISGASGGINVDIAAILPVSYDEEEESNPADTWIKEVNKEITRDRKMVAEGYGRTMKIERGGLTVSIAVGYDIYGNFRATESCTEPVLFRRTITAKADAAEEAEKLMATLQIRNASGELINIYPNGFPRGWSAALGDKRVAIPRPQDAERAESKLGSLYVQQWDEKGSRWGVLDYFNSFEGAPAELAKLPEFYQNTLHGTSTVDSADYVEWNGANLVRVKGHAGEIQEQ